LSLEGKTVFLTGAFGFIGSNLALHLDSLGAKVVALRRDEVRDDNPLVRKVLERVTVVRGDLREMETVLRVINEYEAQLCIHLAAQAIVGVANRSPLSTFSSNIQGTWNLLEACRLCPSVEGIVSASSDKAYGTARGLPYREEDPLLARNPYDVSKACADLLAQAYGDHYGMPIVVSRCSNVYGPGDLNLSRIVPEICRSVALGQPPRLRSDGTMLRDFIHVEDVVRAYEAISAALLSKRCRQEVFNIGTGRPTRVIDMTNIIIEASGKDLRPVVGPAAPKGEIPHQYVAAEKIQEALGWGPKVELREGVRRTYRWYADYFSRSA
jgi:CDP-glucose 4,6-dehydratase